MLTQSTTQSSLTLSPIGTKENPIDLTEINDDDDNVTIEVARCFVEKKIVECEICCEVRTGKMIQCVKCVGKCCVVCLMMTDQCPFCRVRR